MRLLSEESAEAPSPRRPKGLISVNIVDIHPHVISPDTDRYPFTPAHGIMSDWASVRGVSGDELATMMKAARIDRAVLVQVSTAYGEDNTYTAECAEAYPDQFIYVGAVDPTQPDAPDRMTHWVRERGMVGARIFAVGSMMHESSGSWLDDPKTFPTWERARELGIPMCVQTRVPTFPRLRRLLDRFGDVRVILDHLSRPPVDDGPPYKEAQPFFDLAQYPNLYLKISTRNFNMLAKAPHPSRPFIEKLVETFGSKRIAWGSNFPSNEGTLIQLRDMALRELAFLPEADQRAILCETALDLYPKLKTLQTAAA